MVELTGQITNMQTKKSNGKTGLVISHDLKFTCSKLPAPDMAKLSEIMESGPVRITVERIQATFDHPKG